MKLPTMVALAALLALGAAGTARAQFVMDLGSLIAAIRIGDFGDDVEKLGNANNIYVERVSRLSGIRINGDILDNAVAVRWRVLRYLHAQIRQIPGAIKALKLHHATVEQVIFLTATNDGSATLYVDDR